MTRLAEILAGPWTDQDQRRLDRFLTEKPMRTRREPRPTDPLMALRFEAARTFTGWVPAEGRGPLHISRLRKLERAGQAEVSQERRGAFEYAVARPTGWRRPTDQEAHRRLRLLDACRRDGPDSDEALAAVADGETLGERDLLEAIRLAAGARYSAAGDPLA